MEKRKTTKSSKRQDDGQVEGMACSLPKVRERELSSSIPGFRERLIRIHEKKWANGTVLHYYFFERPTDGENGSWVGAQAQKDVVRRAFKAWKDLGIGLEFREVDDREDAEIRIGFDWSDGSWSYVGRDVIDFVPDPNKRTMNFGWDLTTDHGWTTALHEIGHTLGFPHEHQNPHAGIEWNIEAVYDYFRGPPNNWDDDSIHWNILRKISPEAVMGSNWDPNSVMHYAFRGGLIKEPTEFADGLWPPGGLSDTDSAEVIRFYPPIEEEEVLPELRPLESHRLLIQAGDQVSLRIEPDFSREYTIQTFGVSDTVLVLFELDGDEPRFLRGDDDSGFDRNARMRLRLRRGRKYILRVRLYYSEIEGQTAVFMY